VVDGGPGRDPGVEQGEPDAVRARLGELVAGIRRRDPDAVAAAYVLTEAMLASVAYVIVRDEGIAQDVVHDAFLRLLDHADRLREDDGRGLRAWLVRTTRNRALDHVRSGRVRLEETTDRLPEEADADPTATALQDPELLAALTRLGEDQRDALLLFHVVGMDGREVADVLGRSRAAVYTLLRRAERSLRTTLADVQSEADGSSLQWRDQ